MTKSKLFIFLCLIQTLPITAIAQEMSASDLLKRLRQFKTTPGIQIGVIIDSHKGNKPYAELIDVPTGHSLRTYNVLHDLLRADKGFDGEYSDCGTADEPNRAFVTSFFNITRTGKGDAMQAWAFVVGSPDYSFWSLPLQNHDPKKIEGICDVNLRDGSLIGFTYTQAKKTLDPKGTPILDYDGYPIYEPINMPRLPK
jgi:hypothetical protein